MEYEDIRRDEEGYILIPSLWPLYCYSEIQGCWIPKDRDLIVYFTDREGSPVSVRYAKQYAYWQDFQPYTSRAAYEDYEARRIAYLRELQAEDDL